MLGLSYDNHAFRGSVHGEHLDICAWCSRREIRALDLSRRCSNSFLSQPLCDGSPFSKHGSPPFEWPFPKGLARY